ncbi:hypothetical protein RDV89_17210 [Nocardioides zeae]|uniref:Uncharacterized protein n=1 Tax=Nocardioides imazamoxiresistens TaxID=3231893 RepID=A0ABU3PZZ9_9ACTN|nr:hypothetical protein [Nocardioides zeae]MDT9594830.1 hypothetical protein [Nocardioides zeae]
MNDRETAGQLIDFSVVASEPAPPHDVPGLPTPDEVDPGAVPPTPPDGVPVLTTSMAGLVSGYPVEETQPH